MADSRQYVESIGRGFKLLTIVCRSALPLSLSELSKESDLSISTIQRLSYTLQRLGFLDRDQRTKKFKIGPEMISLSFAVIDNLSLKKVAFPYMQQLSKQLGEVVALATLSGTQIILIESIKTQQVLNVNTNEGVSIPAHATASGKAILAFLPETEAERIVNEAGFVKLTDNTITSMKAFKNLLSNVRERGFATAVDENNYGLSAVAAPIRGNNGEVIASLTIMVPTARVTEKKLIEEYSSKVIQTAERISFDSGYRKKNSHQS
jgi:IclR family KDG regulon transcriptional repressor